MSIFGDIGSPFIDSRGTCKEHMSCAKIEGGKSLSYFSISVLTVPAPGRQLLLGRIVICVWSHEREAL